MKRLLPWGWVAFGILLVLHVHTQSFNDELQQENERLKKKVASAPPVFTSPVCPSGVWVQQEYLRWKNGKVIGRQWKSNCLTGKEAS